MKDVKIMHKTTSRKVFLSTFEKDIVNKVQISHFSEIMYNSRNNIDIFIFSFTHFKGKFTKICKKHLKKLYYYFTEFWKSLNLEPKRQRIQTCKTIYEKILKINIFNFSKKFNWFLWVISLLCIFKILFFFFQFLRLFGSKFKLFQNLEKK